MCFGNVSKVLLHNACAYMILLIVVEFLSTSLAKLRLIICLYRNTMMDTLILRYVNFVCLLKILSYESRLMDSFMLLLFLCEINSFQCSIIDC